MPINHTFHEYVTSGIFNLTLTKNMIQVLEALYSNDQRAMINHGRWVPTIRSLENRGLTQHLGDMCNLDKLAQKEGWQYAGEWLRWNPLNRVFLLTEAGYLVCELLKQAGLIDPELKKAPPFKNPTKPWSKRARELYRLERAERAAQNNPS